MIECTKVVKTNFEEILANTPEGKIAMFEITSVPSSMDAERWLEQYVYVTKKGKFLDPITRQKIEGEPAGVIFMNYVKKDW